MLFDTSGAAICGLTVVTEPSRNLSHHELSTRGNNGGGPESSGGLNVTPLATEPNGGTTAPEGIPQPGIGSCLDGTAPGNGNRLVNDDSGIRDDGNTPLICGDNAATLDGDNGILVDSGDLVKSGKLTSLGDNIALEGDGGIPEGVVLSGALNL